MAIAAVVATIMNDTLNTPADDVNWLMMKGFTFY